MEHEPWNNKAYHRKGVDEITVYGIERAGVVVRRRADCRQIDSLLARSEKNLYKILEWVSSLRKYEEIKPEIQI